MKQDKKYVEPKAEVIYFQSEDIILTSNGVGGGDVNDIVDE